MVVQHAFMEGRLMNSIAPCWDVAVLTNVIVLQGSQQRGSRILGFFWVPPPTASTPTPTVSTLIVVTQAGLELWTLTANSQVLAFREARKHPTQWFIYSHEMRLVLLGSGEPSSLWLQVRESGRGVAANPFCQHTLIKTGPGLCYEPI